MKKKLLENKLSQLAWDAATFSMIGWQDFALISHYSHYSLQAVKEPALGLCHVVCIDGWPLLPLEKCLIFMLERHKQIGGQVSEPAVIGG